MGISSKEKRDRAADLRLQREYGLTLVEYDIKLAAQGGKCGCCGRPPGATRLCVDHNHAVARTKIRVLKQKFSPRPGLKATKNLYIARAFFSVNDELVSSGEDRAAAVATVQRMLKRRSVRGLLCFICNKLVLGRLERVKIQPAKVIAYLEKFDPTNPLLVTT